MKNKILIIILALTAILSIYYLFFVRQKVEVVIPNRREAISALYSSGVVRAENSVKLRTEISGRIKSINAKNGEEVWENTIVAELDAVAQNEALKEQAGVIKESNASLHEAQVAYNQELASIAVTDTNSDKSADTTEKSIDPEKIKSISAAKQRLDRTKALVKTLQTSLQNRKRETNKGKIITPMSGILTRLKTSVGEVVPQNYEVATIIDPLSFKIYADIDELDIARVQIGQEAIVAFDALPNSRFRARIERVVPQVDEKFKTITAILSILDIVPNLSDGMTTNLNIIEQRKTDAITIPASTLVEEKNNEAFVFVVKKDNSLEKRKIRVGIRGENYVEVTFGLTENDRVVLVPNSKLSDGLKVETNDLNNK